MRPQPKPEVTKREATQKRTPQLSRCEQGQRVTSRWTLAVFLAAMSLPPASMALAGPVDADHNCMGPWVGLGRSTGHDEPWTITLNLTAAPAGGRCGTIEYTNPRCGGTLESCRTEGDSGDIHTRERYTHTDGDCAPPGDVIIRCEGDTMRYSWLGWERVDSTLHRPTNGSPPRQGSRPPSSGEPAATEPTSTEGAPAPITPRHEPNDLAASSGPTTHETAAPVTTRRPSTDDFWGCRTLHVPPSGAGWPIAGLFALTFSRRRWVRGSRDKRP